MSDTPRSSITTPASPATISNELIALLRQRIQSHFYDRPDVIAALAQTIASRGAPVS